MQTMNSTTVPARSNPRRHHQAPLQQWDAAAPWRASPLPGENLLQLLARVRRERRYFGPIALI